MLRKKDNGETEVFYVESFEEKQLYDSQRKKYRQLKQPLSKTNTRESLRNRQKLARELRTIITTLKGDGQNGSTS